jgi:hypothetical protein
MKLNNPFFLVFLSSVIGDVPKNMAEATGLPFVACQLILTCIVYFGLVFFILALTENNANQIWIWFVSSFFIVALLSVIEWMPMGFGIMVILVLIVALLYAVKVRDVIGGKWGGGNE